LFFSPESPPSPKLDSVHDLYKDHAPRHDGDAVEKIDDFGELLIEALEEAVAYKQGKRPGLRITRHEVTNEETTPSSKTGDHGRAS
jgi:hypothetical protein